MYRVSLMLKKKIQKPQLEKISQHTISLIINAFMNGFKIDQCYEYAKDKDKYNLCNIIL